MAAALLPLADIATRMGWSRQTLRRRLVAHRIATIGTGKRARLTEADVQLLIARERALGEPCLAASTHPARADDTGPGAARSAAANTNSVSRRRTESVLASVRRNWSADSVVTPIRRGR